VSHTDDSIFSAFSFSFGRSSALAGCMVTPCFHAASLPFLTVSLSEFGLEFSG